MPLNVVIPSNLDTDFTIDIVKSKIYNNSIIIGTGVPVANPPVEEKVWLYAKSDNGGVAGDYAISHVWEPATLVWEPLGAAVDFRLTAVSVDANTGEVTFTITDPASGATSTITTDLTNLVDVQETLTVLAEVAPGQLNYTDEDLTVNVVDISGLRDTGQTAQRVEIIGDTFNVTPNGADTRIVVDDVSSTATFVDGANTIIHYTGDNVLGYGENGDAGIILTPDYFGVNYLMTSGTGLTTGLMSADNDFSASSAVNVSRDATTDISNTNTTAQSDAGNSSYITVQADATLAEVNVRTRAQSATTYSLIDLDTSATNSTVSISSFMGADNRNIIVAPASIEIGAGDVAANAVGGTNGDVLVRFGTGSEVRFAPIGAAIGAELNVNTATPALELEVSGAVVDTVPLVDVLDAFNVHQFYAIP